MNPSEIQEASVVMALYGIDFYCAACQDLVGTIRTNLFFLGLGFQACLFLLQFIFLPFPSCLHLCSPAGEGFQALRKKIWAYIPCSDLFPCSS